MSTAFTEPPPTGDVAEAASANYRPMSILAIAAFVFSLFGFLGTFDPVLEFVPVASLVLAVLAYLDFLKEEPPAGKNFARAALVVAATFSVAGPAKTFVRGELLARQARQFADRFFDALHSGRNDVAYQLMQEVDRRTHVTDVDELIAYYAENPEQQSVMVTMHQQEPYANLLAAGEQGETRFLHVLARMESGNTQLLSLEYEFTFPPEETGDRSRSPWYLQANAERAIKKSGDKLGKWRIASVEYKFAPFAE